MSLNKLPDLNCYNVTVVENEIKFTKKSQTQRLTDKIKHQEKIIDEKNKIIDNKEDEIKDLKSSIYDMSDSSEKAIKNIKRLKWRVKKLRNQFIEIKSKLSNLAKSRKSPSLSSIREILENINDTWQSDDDSRSVSCLTLSDAGSIYYPSKPSKSPLGRLAPERQSKLFIGKRSRSKNFETLSNDAQKEDLQFDVEDVFLPAETMNSPWKFNKKKPNLYLNVCQSTNKLSRLDLCSQGFSNRENKEPNRRYGSPQNKDELNESVIRVSAVRESYQMSDILAASSRKGESPIRGSDIFERKDDDIVLKSIDFAP